MLYVNEPHSNSVFSPLFAAHCKKKVKVFSFTAKSIVDSRTLKGLERDKSEMGEEGGANTWQGAWSQTLEQGE